MSTLDNVLENFLNEVEAFVSVIDGTAPHNSGYSLGINQVESLSNQAENSIIDDWADLQRKVLAEPLDNDMLERIEELQTAVDSIDERHSEALTTISDILARMTKTEFKPLPVPKSAYSSEE